MQAELSLLVPSTSTEVMGEQTTCELVLRLSSGMQVFKELTPSPIAAASLGQVNQQHYLHGSIGAHRPCKLHSHHALAVSDVSHLMHAEGFCHQDADQSFCVLEHERISHSTPGRNPSLSSNRD